MNKFMAKLMQKIENKLPENAIGGFMFRFIVDPVWKYFSDRWIDEAFSFPWNKK